MLLDALLLLVVLLNLGMLGTSRLSGCIRLFAAQSILLSLVPVLLHPTDTATGSLHAGAIALGALALKGIVIPNILLRVLASGEIHREVQPFLGFKASFISGALIVILSFGIATRLVLPVPPPSPLLVPVAIATALIGMMIMVTRLKAVTQVVGYLVLENGVYLFGLLLLERIPLLVEVGILLDLFVAVFIMGIVVYQIRREFDHMDTHLLAGTGEE